MNILPPEERIDLTLKHGAERDRRVCDRIKALLLYDDGWTNQAIVRALLLSEEAIRKHIRAYENAKKLKPGNEGSKEKQTEEQGEELVAHLEKQVYLRAVEVVKYVEKTYGADYTQSGMVAWLRDHGFSYYKPAVVPGKVNVEAQAKWIAGYRELRATLPENEAICFTDGVHPVHNTVVAAGWIKQGVRKEIKTNTGRQRINLNGAIDIATRKEVIQEAEALNTETTIAFFKTIEAAYPLRGKGSCVFRQCALLQKRNGDGVFEGFKSGVVSLASHSPNLNPIERLWKLMREKVLHNQYYENFRDYKRAVLGFFKSWSDYKRELSSRINDNFQLVGFKARPSSSG